MLDLFTIGVEEKLVLKLRGLFLSKVHKFYHPR